MKNEILEKLRHSKMLRALSGGCVAMLCTAVASGAHGSGYGRAHPYGYGYPHQQSVLRQDMNRLREQMRRQQKRLEEQTRLQQEQIRLLRQQLTVQHQVSAMQACHYRFNAGLDLCADLFDTASADYASCRSEVVKKNPACAEGMADSASGSGD